jgi:hypothetical protein
MSDDNLIQLIGQLTQSGSMAGAAGILAYQSPKIIKEIFTGIKMLRTSARRKD